MVWLKFETQTEKLLDNETIKNKKVKITQLYKYLPIYYITYSHKLFDHISML